jgi:hypothetical protein
MPTKRVLCAECARETKLLTDPGGVTVKGCKPIPGDPSFCLLEYEYTFMAPPAAGGKPPTTGGNK